MKICPRCQKTYSDDGLNFCLDDGATLTQPVDNSIPATVLLNQPLPTDPNPSFGNQSGWNPNQNQFSMQSPPKKSKSWLWALGILGGLILLCGGGLIGFVFWAASLENSNRTGNANYASNLSQKSPAPVKSPAPKDRTTAQKIDLSNWVQDDNDSGVTEFVNGDFLMSSKKKGYYYVLASPSDFKTEDAVTKVTVKNVNEDSTRLGFGLLIHSSPIPLMRDYAFLIDSESKKYRVVRHVPGDEISVVGWTRSSAIKDGTQENVLEVRDENKKMNFYINGEFIKTFDNTDGFEGGVTGIYSGDGVQIAFSDLEIRK